MKWPLVTRRSHEASLAAVREAWEARRQADLKDMVGAVRHGIAEERERCARVAASIPTSARGAWMRSEILRGIQEAPQPDIGHKDLAKTTEPRA